ncbi:phosphopantetheine-protein transferase [Leptolinea sp. HRD-7]|jgi:4'-phosphopantetheinyl transferase|nr:phosphopantetheine-protein transferase [Leptolinea sp. HRD-7]
MNKMAFDTSLMRQFTIQPGIDVWYTRMDEYSPSSFDQFLSSDEKAKAMKIRDAVKSRFAIISRGILRVLLGRYLSISPVDVSIETREKGKPMLSPGLLNRVAFNVSHSQGVLAIAISKNNPVGIDIEKKDLQTNPQQASRLVFSPEEKSYLEKRGNLLNDFFGIWTIKESILKATGDGFSYPSHEFSVISSNNSSILNCFSGPVTSEHKCEIHTFSLYRNYVGALAVIYP